MPAGGGLRTDRFIPGTMMLGLAVILVCEVMLFADVALRGWVIVPNAELAPPTGLLEILARWFAVNATPICWVGALLVLDGLLVLQSKHGRNLSAFHGSPVRGRPKRFILCFLASVPIWLLFDWINFTFMGAWDYHGLPEHIVPRYLAYFFAFGAICPAMFLFAQLFQGMGLYRVSGKKLEFSPFTHYLLMFAGLLCIVFPIAVRDPIGSLTLWLGWVLLLDPVNHRLGAPSLLGDWRQGRWGRTLALLFGGMVCGFLWEFWNYWAVAKWTYDLPFLGALETYRYFEMPWPGMLGFPPFALECWVMFQTVAWLCEKLKPVSLEPLPDNKALL